MNLSKASEDALKAWYGPSTWHTPHDYDMGRWYDFVNQYQRDHGYAIDEADLCNHIEAALGDVNDTSREIIQKRISLAYNILDFLKRSKR